MLPVLKRGMSGPEVKDLQAALNRHKKRKGGSRLDDLEPDGVFGGLTDGRVRELQRGFGLEADGHVGPLTRQALFADAYAVVSEAQRVATSWMLLGLHAAAGLRNSALAGPCGPPPAKVPLQALRTHFHFALADPQAPSRLHRIVDVLAAVQGLLAIASIEQEQVFFLGGPHVLEAKKKKPPFPLATAFHDERAAFFGPRYTEGHEGFDQEAKPVRNVLVGAMIHECCHLLYREIVDYAYERPAPRGSGAPGGPTPGKFYDELDTDEAMKNAASYQMFVTHVVYQGNYPFSSVGDDVAVLCGQGEPAF